MSGWATSDRKDRLPPDWAYLVRTVKERDGFQCVQLLPSGKRCPRGRATGDRLEVDHRRAGDDHCLANLQTLCAHHHSQKTAREGLASRLPPASKRTEKHPGDVV